MNKHGHCLRAFKAWLSAVRMWLIIIALLTSGLLLLLYTSLSIYGKQLLTPREFVRFAGIISFTSVAHIHTNGGPRAWVLIGDSLSEAALSQAQLEFDSQIYQIPLPPNTIRKSCDRISPGTSQSCLSGARFPSEFFSYVTVASPEELDGYFNKTLPAAGWMLGERAGSALWIQKGNTRLMMIWTYHLTTQISEINVSQASVLNDQNTIR